MRAAAWLRGLGLAVAIACAGLLVHQASLLALPSGGPHVFEAADPPAPPQDAAGLPPMPRAPSAPPLQGYASLAGGSRFRYAQPAMATPVAADDAPQLLPDRLGDLVLVGVMWDEASGTGLASVTVGEGHARIVPAGDTVGGYRILAVGRDWADIADNRTRRRLRPRPPIMEKTRAGS